MSDTILAEIRSDRQIKKFCAYGFLKNLKFFEPYLLIFLMSKGLSLFEIGILIGIREIFINLFEIPSGLIADYFGRKKELYICFFFYILSFLCCFFLNSFLTAAIAMSLFGLGEAFRSGTHKAMIYTYLDQKGWRKQKTFVYGRTRSFSLIGSAVSAVLGIVLILLAPSVNYIFLFSVIPYFLDLLLILSYPDSLDRTDKKTEGSFRQMFSDSLKHLRQRTVLRHLLLEEGIFESTISFSKDMIQPILEAIILGSGLVVLSSLSREDNLHILLGLVYAGLNLFGSVASQKAYILRNRKGCIKCLFIIHLALASAIAVLSVAVRNSFAVLLIYLLIYFLFNVRKPIFVDEIDEHIEKSSRATALSVASQLKSLFLMILAPFAGWIADHFGLGTMLLLLSLFFFATLPLLISGKQKE